MENLEIQSTPWQLIAQYHKLKTEDLKHKLKATYVSHVKEGNKKLLKVILPNEIGGKDTIMININGEIGDKFYKDVLTQIKAGDYASEERI